MTAFFDVAILAEVSGKLSAIEKRAEWTAQAETAERDIVAALRLPTIDEAEAALDRADHTALEAELVELKARFDDQDQRSRDASCGSAYQPSPREVMPGSCPTRSRGVRRMP